MAGIPLHLNPEVAAETIEPRSERRESLPLAVALVWGCGAAVLAVGLAVRFFFRIPLATLTRDPLATLEAPFYIGAISNVGVLAWAAAATICFFTSCLLRHEAGQVAPRRFLLYFGLLTALLLADDLFLLHEDVLYGYLRVPEVVTFGVYGLLGAIGVVRFRSVIRGTDVLLLGMALALWCLSLLSDLMPDARAQHLVEDGAKLVGILAWLAYLARASATFLRRARG